MSAGEKTSQLEWEARLSRPAALCAFASAALILTGFFLPSLAGNPGDSALEGITLIAEESTTFVIAWCLEAVGVALLAPVFYYLARATRARREQLAVVALVLGVAGPLLLAIAGLVFRLPLVDAIQDYLATPSPTDEGAEGVATASPVVDGIRLAADLAVSFAYVLVSLNAMRAGLFSRFLGILGVAVGVLRVLPVLGPPVPLQVFWAMSVGILFLNRWPGGRGPAWERGEAIPWPGAAERMAAQRRVPDAAGAPPADEPTDASARSELDRPRPASRKRRRGRAEPG